MGGLFGGPSLPAVKPAIDPPKATDPEVTAAAAKERKLQRLRRGRQSTLLTNVAAQTGTQKTNQLG